MCVRSGRAYCNVDINTPAERIAQKIEKFEELLVLMTDKSFTPSEIEKREVFADNRWVIGYETISPNVLMMK